MNTESKRVVLASNNAGKLKEFSAILAQAGISMVPQGQLNIPEAEEPFATFIENALAKARHASQLSGLPALADDSGLCVRALDEAPGVYSARFAARELGGEKSDSANNALLVQRLQGQSDRRACYVAVLAYVRHAQDPRPIVIEGVWEGEIQDQPAGEHGFGYDPHFYLPEFKQTAAQLSPELKNKYSHRAQAMQALLARLAAE